jgi:hypothetical protein
MTLDSWEPELVKVMAELGNEAVNRVYEHQVDASKYTRATAHCPRDVREAWIRAKYLQKAFMRTLPSGEDGGKRWSVQRRKRRTSCPPEDAVSGKIIEAFLLTQVCSTIVTYAADASQDSGLGQSDVIVFGTEVTPPG